MGDKAAITLFTTDAPPGIMSAEEVLLLELRKSVKATIRQSQWQLSEIDKRLAELKRKVA